MSVPPTLSANESVLSAAAYAFAARMCAEMNQAHVFAAWPAPGARDAEKQALVAQCMKLDAQYPNGLAQYVANARTLLEASRAGTNPYDGWSPAVPDGERLAYGTPAFDAAEACGMEAMRDAAFVIVAGGLGERLGYHGIKVALPVETATGTCYLGKYCQHILALQARCNAAASGASSAPSVQLPLCVMTSGDTHDKTVSLLTENDYFGMADGQITLVRQELVPALMDNDGRFAISDSDPYLVQTKPHGHGDVHMLLHMKGVVSRWAEQEGRKWIVFFQDTNGLVFRSVPAAVGVSAANTFALNSLTVPRKPGEPVGGICKLMQAGAEDKTLTINVEYNQLDPLLRATTGAGDVAGDDGFSPYPGNINVLVFHAPTYNDVLKKSGGSIPEFVNPKYKDEAKTVFKKPTRLECMMQDFPKLFGAEHRVGFTQIERWLSFSAVKNNPTDARAKFDKTSFAESASTGEASAYYFARQVLSAHGVKVEASGALVEYAGIPTMTGSKIVLAPRFGTTGAEIRSKFPAPDKVSVSPTSCLVLDGANISVRSLTLDGALVVRAVDGATVVIDGCTESNAGWAFAPVAFDDVAHEEKFRIRGYVPGDRAAERVYDVTEAGSYVIGASGLVKN
jgi:UDP-sugar pyrophosphorylase